MKILNIIIALVLVSGCSNEPSKTEQDEAKNGFYFEQPKNWISATDSNIASNLEKFDMPSEKINELLKNNKGSILISAYTKYDPSNHIGLIPTIQVNLRSNPRHRFGDFKKDIIESIEQVKNQLTNFSITEKLSEIEIDGTKSLFFKSQFDLPSPNGDISKVKSWNYAIPINNFFYQINFSDGFDGEDCSELYSELIKSVKLKKEVVD